MGNNSLLAGSGEMRVAYPAAGINPTSSLLMIQSIASVFAKKVGVPEDIELTQVVSPNDRRTLLSTIDISQLSFDNISYSWPRRKFGVKYVCI